MNPGKVKRNPPRPSAKNNDNGKDELWHRHGVEDVYYQRETQINFFGIMGGVAAAALLTQFFPMLEQVRLSRWYLILYFVASIFILVHGWVQTPWGTLVLKWQISYPIVLTHFLTLISMAIMCLLLTNPVGWVLSAVGAIFFTLLQQLVFWVSGAWVMFSPGYQKRLKTVLLVYIFVILVGLSAAAQMAFLPSRISEIIWGFVVLSVSIALMILQQLGMNQERKDFNIP